VITTRDLLFFSAILAATLSACRGVSRPVEAHAGSSKHVVTLKFDYDFTKVHACSPSVKKKCLKQFNVYDLSGNTPFLLFSFPAPSGSTGIVKDITAKSPLLLFEDGSHRLGVAAQTAEGSESDPHLCTTLVEIKFPLPAP
jgi:hypothetical protein